MHAARFPAGQLIIRQGEPGRYLHLLTAGEVEVRLPAARGTVIPVASLHEGECFGEMSLLSGDLTSVDVVAATDCETLMLDRASFEVMVAEQPGLLREFVRMVSRRLRDSDFAVGAAREKEKELTRFLREARADHSTEFIGKVPAVRDLQRQIEAEAMLDRPLLIQGEPGTGKEMIARLVHFGSGRKEAPLLSTECGKIMEGGWGDKLFGDYRRPQGERGAFSSISYLDLARGGTILLKDIEALPRSIQEHLAAFLQAGSAEVRVMATCRGNLAQLAAAQRVSPALAQALAANVLTVPPLRERKRDIPELAAHLVRKHAQRLNKPTGSLGGGAVVKLVTYDYRAGNVRELEEAIRRAVVLSDEAQITEEVIFLGQPSGPSSWSFNLLELPQPVVRTALRLFPRVVQVFATLFFAFILYECLFAPAGPAGNWGTLLAWSVWWPLAVLSFVFVGRAWCAVCPMSSAASQAQRLFNTRWHIPAWLKEHDMTLIMAGFFAITWAEETLGMRHSARSTGWLLLSISAGALMTALLLPRRAWCRHLCPLGGFASVCSMAGVVELRPTSDICAANCRDHSCYKGGTRIEGCPMFNHLMFVDSNQHCVLCMQCVRNCPNGSPQLNLRLPARELLTMANGHAHVGQFTVLLAGLLVGMILLRRWESHPFGPLVAAMASHRFLVVTGVLAAAAALPQLCLWMLARQRDPAALTPFWQKVAAWVPVVTAGFVCYQLGFLPGADSIRLIVERPAQYLSVSLTSVAQCVILTAGLVLTLAILWNLQAEQARLRKRAAGLILSLACWATLVVLIVL